MYYKYLFPAQLQLRCICVCDSPVQRDRPERVALVQEAPRRAPQGGARQEASERQVRVLLGHGNHTYDPESNTCRPYYIISLDVQHNYIHPSPLLTNITRRLKNHNRIDFAFPTQTENPITPPVALEPGDCYYAA